MIVLGISKFADILGKKRGSLVDAYFAQEGWQLLHVMCGSGDGYQVYFGPGVQVDNNFEYGFPYAFDLDEVKAFAEEFFVNRIKKIRRRRRKL